LILSKNGLTIFRVCGVVKPRILTEEIFLRLEVNSQVLRRCVGIRGESKSTLDEIGRAVGVDASTIHRWSRAQAQIPVADLRKMARAIGLAIWEIVDARDLREILRIADEYYKDQSKKGAA